MMLSFLLGMSPVVAFGLAALWGRLTRSRFEIVDLTAEAPAEKRSKRSRPVDAVVLHQMAFSRGSDIRRYRNVTAHFIIVPDGTVAQLHPIRAWLPSSNGFNSRSVAIEFAGNLRSIHGRWWKPERFGRNTLTTAQIQAGRGLLRALRAAGVRNVFAHRQSSADRGNCPGPEIWSSVGQWAIEELGMRDGGPGFVVGAGQPIPEAWRTYNLDNRKDHLT